MTTTVWMTRKRAVPERAGDGFGEATERLGVVVHSEGRTLTRRREVLPPLHPAVSRSPLPPPGGQRPVEHVVDGHDSEQPTLRVAHGDRHEVVRREADGDLGVGEVDGDGRLVFDAAAELHAGRLAEQPSGSARRRGRCPSVCPTGAASRRPARRARRRARDRGSAPAPRRPSRGARARPDRCSSGRLRSPRRRRAGGASRRHLRAPSRRAPACAPRRASRSAGRCVVGLHLLEHRDRVARGRGLR